MIIEAFVYYILSLYGSVIAIILYPLRHGIWHLPVRHQDNEPRLHDNAMPAVPAATGGIRVHGVQSHNVQKQHIYYWFHDVDVITKSRIFSCKCPSRPSYRIYECGRCQQRQMVKQIGAIPERTPVKCGACHWVQAILNCPGCKEVVRMSEAETQKCGKCALEFILSVCPVCKGDAVTVDGKSTCLDDIRHSFSLTYKCPSCGKRQYDNKTGRLRECSECNKPNILSECLGCREVLVEAATENEKGVKCHRCKATQRVKICQGCKTGLLEIPDYWTRYVNEHADAPTPFYPMKCSVCPNERVLVVCSFCRHQDEYPKSTPLKKCSQCNKPYKTVPNTENTPICIFCYEKPVDAVLVACGHAKFCSTCIRQHIQTKRQCPVCRTPLPLNNVDPVMRIFLG